MAQQKSYEIRISVLDGCLNYDHPKCHARRNEEIVWTCKDGPFAIQFFGISPVESPDAQSVGLSPVKNKVRYNAAGGTYSYACAVCADNQVYLDASCPVIIIDYP
jgi:hypothetical protein